jgi:hypothetical protein
LGSADVTARFTLPLNPVCGVTVILSVTDDPATTDIDDDDALSVNPGGGLIVTSITFCDA